jgi:hypothetical protein
MQNEYVKTILGQDELQTIAQEIEGLQELGMSLQAVGLQTASDKVMQSCRRISNVLRENSLDIRSTEFPDPSM